MFSSIQVQYQDVGHDPEGNLGNFIEMMKKKDVIVLRRCPIVGPHQSIERLFYAAYEHDSNGRNIEIHNQSDVDCCNTPYPRILNISNNINNIVIK